MCLIAMSDTFARSPRTVLSFALRHSSRQVTFRVSFYYSLRWTRGQMWYHFLRTINSTKQFVLINWLSRSTTVNLSSILSEEISLARFIHFTWKAERWEMEIAKHCFYMRVSSNDFFIWDLNSRPGDSSLWLNSNIIVLD